MNTIFITGTTRGIGRETALRFARAGWRVFGCGRDEDKIAGLNELAKKENLALEVFRMDVTSQADVDAGTVRVMEATGGNGPDVLINNAGYQELGPAEDLTLDTWHKQFETNVFGYLRVTKVFLPKMRERKQGRVILLSSMAGRSVLPYYGAYCATKHAVEAIGDALRMELKPFGVKIVLIEPGPIISNINITGYDNMAKSRPPMTAYGKVYDAGKAMLDHVEKISFPTSMAADVIFTAATATRPKQRYRVSSTATLAILTKKCLPGWLSDYIFSHSN